MLKMWRVEGSVPQKRDIAAGKHRISVNKIDVRKGPLGRSPRLAIPVPSAAQSFFKLNEGPIAEDFFGTRDIRLRITNITAPRRIILRRDFLSGDLLEQSNDFVQSDAGTSSAVEDYPRSARRIRRAEGLIYHIVYESEVAGLFAISIDHWTLVFQDGQHES